MKILRSTWVVLVMLAAVGCAGFGSLKNLPPEEQVRHKAQAWLDAILDHDVRGAYELTSPSYRKFATWGHYNARVQGTRVWDAGEIDTISCQESACSVRIIVEYRIEKMNVDVRRPREYKWVKSDDEWWLYVSPG